ncbi:cell surface glyco 1 [Fusarium sporotrichioides]|uniref:Cell surface glyco 1 n=1 Tax=Fusarium sporotrichioides TaxID=5514 RepID=A0A395SES6_FUSSP|nr:cell surface glyco 1 [Fusarium sporotrichioides]
MTGSAKSDQPPQSKELIKFEGPIDAQQSGGIREVTTVEKPDVPEETSQLKVSHGQGKRAKAEESVGTRALVKYNKPIEPKYVDEVTEPIEARKSSQAESQAEPVESSRDDRPATVQNSFTPANPTKHDEPTEKEEPVDFREPLWTNKSYKGESQDDIEEPYQPRRSSELRVPVNSDRPDKPVESKKSKRSAKAENSGKGSKSQKAKKSKQANLPGFGHTLHLHATGSFLREAESRLESINSDLETNKTKKEDAEKKKASSKRNDEIAKLDKKRKELKDKRKMLERKVEALQGALEKSQKSLR